MCVKRVKHDDGGGTMTAPLALRDVYSPPSLSR